MLCVGWVVKMYDELIASRYLSKMAIGPVGAMALDRPETVMVGEHRAVLSKGTFVLKTTEMVFS